MTGGLLELSAAAGVVLGVVQAFKTAGLPARWSPLAAVFLGAAAGPFVFAGDLAAQVVAGVIAGLSAVGLYSTAAHTRPAPAPTGGGYLAAVGPARYGDDQPEG